ncbi:predicted protein [Nematostella vectensis]|uniref:L-seryl-tRNA(Sec) kinase n=1 Tax=Nematostella vectensis TaxID=45351 RepID=A7SGR4_NEMVE|nr:predicted protein [Nematostella vectensis]|eukprot:XP_001629172.1 predicted protein [Nematostella vectensis]
MADREGKSDCFLVLCGLPACGKTTLVNEFIQWKRHNIYDDTHVLHICYDEFIPSNLYEDEDGLSQQCMSANTPHETRGRSLWKWYRKLLLLSVERLVRILRIDTTDIGSTSDGHFRLKSETRDNFHEGKTELSGFWPQFIQKLRDTGKLCKCLVDDSLTLRCCHVIILDDNMFYRGMRYEYYQLARKCGLGYAQLFIDCSIDSALQRNVSRSNPVTMETIKTMTKRLEHPNPEKYFWEQNTLTIKGTEATSDCMKALVLLIKNAASHPVPPLPTEDEPLKEKLQKANLDSLLHQADKVLRRTISKKMESSKKTSLLDSRTSSLDNISYECHKRYFRSLVTALTSLQAWINARSESLRPDQLGRHINAQAREYPGIHCEPEIAGDN